jgi:hypothetical protein
MLFGWEQVLVIINALIVIRAIFIKLHFLLFTFEHFPVVPAGLIEVGSKSVAPTGAD